MMRIERLREEKNRKTDRKEKMENVVDILSVSRV